jgi:hypothetical protein
VIPNLNIEDSQTTILRGHFTMTRARSPRSRSAPPVEHKAASPAHVGALSGHGGRTDLVFSSPGRGRPELVDPVADQRWLELLARSPAAGPFHHRLWLELLRGQYGYPIALVGVAQADGELVAGLRVARVSRRLTATRLVALRFSDGYSPVVAEGASDDVGVADEALDAFLGDPSAHAAARCACLVAPERYRWASLFGPLVDRVESLERRGGGSKDIVRTTLDGCGYYARRLLV